MNNTTNRATLINAILGGNNAVLKALVTSLTEFQPMECLQPAEIGSFKASNGRTYTYEEIMAAASKNQTLFFLSIENLREEQIESYIARTQTNDY